MPTSAARLAGDDLGVVDGGATRAESVRNALERVGTELVAIHDAARPLVTPELIEEVVATLVADPGAAGAIAATPVTDTIKRAAPGAMGCICLPRGGKWSTRDRGDARSGRLWAAQTPQVFRIEALRGR